MNNYEVIELIGEGAYGVVLKARRRQTGEVVAIKKFKQTDEDEIIKKTTMREIKVLKSLKHKNIVELEQAFKKKGLVHLVFEYLDNNLLEVLEKNPAGLQNKTIAKYMYQVLEGLDYMHSLHYVHRDIKPENLLVSSEGVLKICDMGFAKSIQDQMTDYVATRWYRPPELLLGAKYGTPIDIWALGCIMAELSDTQPLFPGSDQVDQLMQIMVSLGELPDHLKAYLELNTAFKNVVLPSLAKNDNILNKYKNRLSEKGVDLLKKMLVLDPAKRITAGEALNHAYFDIIRPKKQRLQKTSEAWTAKTITKINLLTENYTDRNSRISEFNLNGNMNVSLDKQHVLKQKASNVFFKFGHKNWQTELKIDSSKLGQLEKGINKIYRKKTSEKSACLTPYHRQELKPEKSATVMGHRTNVNFKISQKNREKSTFMVNI